MCVCVLKVPAKHLHQLVSLVVLGHLPKVRHKFVSLLPDVVVGVILVIDHGLIEARLVVA